MPTDPSSDISFSSALKAVEDLIAAAARVGVRPPQTRWHKYAKVLRGIVPTTPYDATVAEALWEATEAEEFFPFLQRLPDELLRAHARHLLSGQVRAHDDTDNKARNTQWEVAVGARLDSILPGAVSLGEPDVVVQDRGQHLHVACKRLSSANRLGDRLSDGATQLAASMGTAHANTLGLIAVDLSRVMPLNTAELEANHRSPVVEDVNAWEHSTIQVFDKQLREQSAGMDTHRFREHVGGVLLHSRTTVQIGAVSYVDRVARTAWRLPPTDPRRHHWEPVLERAFGGRH